jgi:hypothetical protein
MKKSLILVSLAVLMMLFSCKKDEDTSLFDAKYTDETPEQSKANVEQNAIDLVDQLDNLSSATAIEVLMNFNNLQGGVPAKSAKVNPVLEPLSLISSLGDKSNVSNVFNGMKLAGELMVEDPMSFSALFDSIAGKYTYNFETGEFDESVLEDKVVFEFPGKETDITNTAVITIDNFSVAEITDPLEQWPSGLDTELPASIRMDLKYNGTSVAGAEFSASYKSDGMPTRVSVEIFVDDFTLTAAVTHSPYSSASWKNTLKFQSEVLFETYIAAEGNWSGDNISDNIEEVTYTDDFGTWTETQTHIEEIIRNANAHVILMNLQVVGTVNVKALGDAIWALDEQRDVITEEEFVQAEVDAINANAKLIVIYRDSNTKIAEAEAYVDSYYDSYDETTEYYPAMRFVYADGSKVDVETYVNNELDNFYTSVNDFIDQLNVEYNLDLGHVGVGK